MSELEWKTKAREMLFDQGLTATEVASRLGYSIESIRKFQQFEAKVREKTGLPSKTHRSRSFASKKVLSQRHSVIGSRIARYRAIQPNEMSPIQLGELLGVSYIRVREMELGFHDFSLRELEKISKLLNVPLAELIQA